MSNEKGILNQLVKIADALTRQAEVMERDVDEELPKDVETAVRNTAHNVSTAYIEYINTDLAETLNDLITRSYANDMARARAIRVFQQKLSEFDGLSV